MSGLGRERTSSSCATTSFEAARELGEDMPLDSDDARRVELEALTVFERLKKRVTSSGFFTIFAVLAATISFLASVFAEKASRSDLLDIGPWRTAAKSAQLNIDQQRQIDDIRRQVQLLRPSTSGPQPPTSPDVSAINKRLDSLEQSQAQLNAIILPSPEKAVAIPMMRRDIDDLKSNNAQVADALKREIDRVYDLNKWIIGGLGAGVLSLAVSQFFRRREKSVN
jgi:hypothetical protein